MNRLISKLIAPWLLTGVLLLVTSAANSAFANSCPFCSAVAQTFSEQMDAHDVVVVAELLEVPPPSDDPDADFPKASLKIVDVLKGDQIVAADMKFRTQLVGSYPVGQQFLVMGVDPPDIAWTTPMKVSDRVVKYLKQTRKLPESGPERLAFFQDYFEDEESMLAFDAYDEFARASYEDLIAMEDRMHHDRIVEWIRDPDTSANRRRLYFTMLGVCGNKQDIQMLEEFIKSDDRKQQRGLDALLAAYLTLQGEAGVDLIEEIFLADLECDYVDTRAAVSALRFHGTESDKISTERIVKAVRHVLDRPKMADMVVADLARWEDWDSMDRLVRMFKEADAETNWIRVPVITYLRACPLPEAEKHIDELAKIDPDAVRRADFFLDGFGDDEDDSEVDQSEGSDRSDESSTSEESAANTDQSSHRVRKVPVKGQNSNGIELNPNESVTVATIENVADADRSFSTSASMSDAVVVAPAPETPPVPVESAPVASVAAGSQLAWMIVVVPLGVSLVLFVLLWSIVNGWFERLIF